MHCLNGATGCALGSVAGSTTTCSSTAGLAGTGFDFTTPGECNSNSLMGGGTGWLTIQGNVVPGETITLRLAIWDVNDGFSDSTVLLDNFTWLPVNVVPGTFLQ